MFYIKKIEHLNLFYSYTQSRLFSLFKFFYKSDLDIFSDCFLTEQEIVEYKLHQPSKKKEWALGRLAAKYGIQAAIKSFFKLEVSLIEIEIKPQNQKKPIFKLILFNNNNIKEIEKSIEFSIAHTRGHAIAAAGFISKNGHVGVDIEKIRKFPENVTVSFLTPYEYQLYKKIRLKSNKNQHATLIWCLKEAYLKAKGTGLAIHPKNIEVRFNSKTKKYMFFEYGKEISVISEWYKNKDNFIISKVNLENKC